MYVRYAIFLRWRCDLLKMPKLDIIIPHYKEDENLMRPMFDILKLQRNVLFTDFRVLIVLDGEDIMLSDDFQKYLKECPFVVTWINVPHGGISAARNAGLDHSTAEWIMWCDSDDALLSTTSLQTFFRFAQQDKALVASAFFEEAPSLEDGHMMLLWHSGNDYIFVHGKMFRREWLVDNRVRFNNNLELHEDAYCIAMARYLLRKEDIVFVKDPLYLWQYNKKSVSRSYDNFVLKTYDKLCKKNSALADELLRRGMFVPAKGIICRTITDAYCRLHSKSWNTPENKEYIQDAEDCVALFLKKYDYIFKAATDVVINAGLYQLRDQMVERNEFNVETTVPFEEWVDSLRK